MEFKEFSEYDNPESTDYDIKSSISSINYMEELVNLIGILEDVTDEDIQREYGISEYEYLHPNADTIEKVKETLNKTKRHR